MSKLYVFSKKFNKPLEIKAKKISGKNAIVLGWCQGAWSKSGGWVQM